MEVGWYFLKLISPFLPALYFAEPLALKLLLHLFIYWKGHMCEVKRQSASVLLSLHHVGPRNWTRIFRLAMKCLYLLSHLPALDHWLWNLCSQLKSPWAGRPGPAVRPMEAGFLRPSKSLQETMSWEKPQMMGPGHGHCYSETGMSHGVYIPQSIHTHDLGLITPNMDGGENDLKKVN